jgi:hypothetical protein
MRRAVRVLAVAALLSGCASAAYPMPSGPPHAGQSQPVRVGQPVTAVLIFLEVRPGDRIELLGAEPIGSVDGASVRFLASRPVLHADGNTSIGEVFEDLAGAVATGAPPTSTHDAYANTIGIVAELTAHRPGQYRVASLRLHYRLNGGGEQVGEGTQVVWLVCADDPAPPDCPQAM